MTNKPIDILDRRKMDTYDYQEISSLVKSKIREDERLEWIEYGYYQQQKNDGRKDDISNSFIIDHWKNYSYCEKVLRRDYELTQEEIQVLCDIFRKELVPSPSELKDYYIELGQQEACSVRENLDKVM